MDRIIDSPALEGWIPIRVYQQDQQPMVDWCYLGPRRFTDPFFGETVEVCLRLPFNLLFRHQTPIETLRQLNETRPGLQPNGFIFHMSRCGSTLVAQMLAALQTNIVISEAALLDRVLTFKLTQPEETADPRVDWLRWLVSALGQPRMGDETQFFIKFDAWNILYLPLIRQAFPQVPWVFLYRDPLEVMVSQFNRRGAHMIPGVIDPGAFELDCRTATTMSAEDYCARVLAAICKGALGHHKDGGLLLNYSQLPEAISSVLDFFGVTYTPKELEIIGSAGQLDAKNPSIPFESDSKKKQEQASGPIRDAAAKSLYPLYEQLEAARTGVILV